MLLNAAKFPRPPSGDVEAAKSLEMYRYVLFPALFLLRLPTAVGAKFLGE